MDNVEINNLLKEAEELGVINIDADEGRLSPEDIKVAINAAKRLNARLNSDRKKIKAKLERVESIVAAQHT